MYSCCVLGSGQNGGESAGFSVFGECSVDLQRGGFVFLPDAAAFVQTHECFRAQMQKSVSGIVCFSV